MGQDKLPQRSLEEFPVGAHPYEAYHGVRAMGHVEHNDIDFAGRQVKVDVAVVVATGVGEGVRMIRLGQFAMGGEFRNSGSELFFEFGVPTHHPLVIPLNTASYVMVYAMR